MIRRSRRLSVSTQRAWCAVGVGCVPPSLDNATFISQSVPTSMTLGQSANVSVTMNNSGTTTWTSNVYKFGSQNPQDNVTWGGSRVLLPAGTTVAPGSNYTFNFTITAPSTAGNYNFQWQMVKEGVAWFGGLTPNVVVNVGSTSTCDPQKKANCENLGGRWNSALCKCNFSCVNGVCP